MSRFHEVFIARGLRDIHNIKDGICWVVDHSMGYTVILSAKAFKAIDCVNKDNICQDLTVGLHSVA